MHLADTPYPKRLTVHGTILSVCVFPGNRTCDLCFASSLFYQLSSFNDVYHAIFMLCGHKPHLLCPWESGITGFRMWLTLHVEGCAWSEGSSPVQDWPADLGQMVKPSSVWAQWRKFRSGFNLPLIPTYWTLVSMSPERNIPPESLCDGDESREQVHEL